MERGLASSCAGSCVASSLKLKFLVGVVTEEVGVVGGRVEVDVGGVVTVIVDGGGDLGVVVESWCSAPGRVSVFEADIQHLSYCECFYNNIFRIYIVDDKGNVVHNIYRHTDLYILWTTRILWATQWIM